MEYKWKALGVVGAGSLMGAIDTTVVVIAFPQIARDLSATLVEMVWVIMIYILMGTALVLSLGRLADLRGRKRLYTTGFAVFVLGSALAGLAQTGVELVAFRAVQGIGGAMLFANSFAIISDAFPANERGRAFGVNTVVWSTGSVLGILVGASILSVTTWRWIFWINVPIGVGATALALVVLRESVGRSARETFDVPAALLFIGVLSAFLYGVTEGILYGWGNPTSLVPIVIAPVLLAAFVVWEHRVSRDPILPLELFRNRLFSVSLVASVLQGVAIFATNFLLMIYFQGIRGTPVLHAAYLMIPLSVALAVTSPIGGRLSDRYGARVVSTVGLLIQAGALGLFSTITPATSLGTVAVYEGVLGLGGGLFFPANAAAIMAGASRRQYGVASGVMMTLRNSSMALSFALSLLALTSQLPPGTAAALFGGAFTPQIAGSIGLSPAGLDSVFLDGMSTAFRVSALFVLVAAVSSALRGREVRRGDDEAFHHRGTPHPFVLSDAPEPAR